MKLEKTNRDANMLYINYISPNDFFRMDNGLVVIGAGGGGVPVIYRRGRYIGVDGIIDKNFASQKTC
ncbi:hypothetical protein ACDX78_14225 [Virgibacillus oceani]